jgi:hypothetical protein
MWVFNFIGEIDQKYDPKLTLDSLAEITVSCDAYSTRFRDPPGMPATGELPAQPADVPPGPTLADGTRLYFGQARIDVEQRVGAAAVDVKNARRGIEHELRLPAVSIIFDRGRVARFRFNVASLLPNVFPAEWQNFSAIGELQVRVPASGDDFAAYLTAWENRAIAAGQERQHGFHVTQVQSGRTKIIRIAMPASSSPETKPAHPDEWLAALTRLNESTGEWRLVALEAVCGEFNTRPPTAQERRMNEMRQAGGTLPLPEIPLVKPEPLPAAP